MIYLEIPYAVENNRVNKVSVKDEIQILNISDEEKASVFEAIYNRYPLGVDFDNKDLKQVLMLQEALHRLGLPYRRVTE